MMTTSNRQQTPRRPESGTITTVAAVLVTEAGEIHRVALSTDSDARLRELQSLVGGLVDVVELAPGLDMWLNDEGVYLCGLNRAATVVAAAHGFAHQPYFGPVVYTGGPDHDGETGELDEAHALLVTGMAMHADSCESTWA